MASRSTAPNTDDSQYEFRAVPPIVPIKFNYNDNTFVVSNTKNIKDILKGDYIARASSTASPRTPAIKAFDTHSDSWVSGSPNNNRKWFVYNNGYSQFAYKKGKYVGGGSQNLYFTTTTTTGEKINGEWLEIKLPYKLQMTRYTLSTQYFPTKFTILGTNDGSDWNILDRQSIPNNPRQKYNLSDPVNYDISPDIRQYNTFRIVFEELFVNENYNKINIRGIQIFGLNPKINLAGQIDNFQTYSNNDMRKIEGFQSVMASEQQLLSDLNDFNSKYARYIFCSNGGTTLKNCTDADQDIATVNEAYVKIAGIESDFNSGSLYEVSSRIGDSTNTNVNHTQAETQYNELKSKHKDIMKMRGELDAKLKELHVTDDSFAYEQKRVFDGTVYTSLIWTVLGTSILFFAFRHL